MRTIAPDPIAGQIRLGRVACIIGVIGLISAFFPFARFVSWGLSALAVALAITATRKQARLFAVAGIVTGAIGLFISLSWIKGAEVSGQGISHHSGSVSHKASKLASADVVHTSVKALWREIMSNNHAANLKYGNSRLRFSGETIENFVGSPGPPRLTFVADKDDYLTNVVVASFEKIDGEEIERLDMGAKITFVCTKVRNTFEGYSLEGCKLEH